MQDMRIYQVHPAHEHEFGTIINSGVCYYPIGAPLSRSAFWYSRSSGGLIKIRAVIIQKQLIAKRIQLYQTHHKFISGLMGEKGAGPKVKLDDKGLNGDTCNTKCNPPSY